MSNKKVRVGSLLLGDGKIYIQSMLNIPAGDVEGTVRQAKELEAAGCEIIRAAIPAIEDVRLIPALKNAVDIPVVAIGGINKDRLEPLKGTGVDGVAVVSAIFAAEDIEKATRELKEAVREIL